MSNCSSTFCWKHCLFFMELLLHFFCWKRIRDLYRSLSELSRVLLRCVYSFLSIFNWSIVDLQCCVNFCYTEKWFIYTYTHTHTYIYIASQVALVVKNLLVNAGDIRDAGSIPKSGRSPGGGPGNPLQYSFLEYPMDRGAWWAAVHRDAKSPTRLKWVCIYMHTL